MQVSCTSGADCRCPEVTRALISHLHAAPRFVRIAAGRYHTLALTAHGQVWTWGFNMCGRPLAPDVLKAEGLNASSFYIPHQVRWLQRRGCGAPSLGKGFHAYCVRGHVLEKHFWVLQHALLRKTWRSTRSSGQCECMHASFVSFWWPVFNQQPVGKHCHGGAPARKGPGPAL